MSINKRFAKKLGLFVFACVILCLHLFAGFESIFLNKITALLSVIICVFLVLKFRKNILIELFCCIFFYSIYSVVFSRYLVVLPRYQEYYLQVDQKVYGLGIAILFLFVLCIFHGLSECPSVLQTNRDDFVSANSNVFFSAVLDCLVVVLFLLSFDFSQFGERGATSPVFEYIGVLICLSYYFAGPLKWFSFNLITDIIILGISLVSLVYGERVAVLQFLIIAFLMRYSNYFSAPTLLGCFFVGIILMNIVGEYRSDYQFEDNLIKTVWNNLQNTYLTFNGADLGYYCTLTFLLVRSFTPFLVRLDLFGEFVQSLILGLSNVSPTASLPFYTRQFYVHQYGGMYPHYFYFYFGWAGVISFSLFCAFIMRYVFRRMNRTNKLQSSSTPYALLGCYIVAVSPRWLLYSPSALFRSVALFWSVFLVLSFLNQSFFKTWRKVR